MPLMQETVNPLAELTQQTCLKFCQGSKGFLRNLAPSRQDVSSTTEWKPSAQPGSPACRPSDCAGRILSKSSNQPMISVQVNIFWGVLGSWKLSVLILAKCSLAQLDGCMSVCGFLMHSGMFTCTRVCLYVCMCGRYVWPSGVHIS